MLSPVKPASRDHQLLLERFLARRSPATRATYLQGLRAFSAWLGAPSPAQALGWLFSCSMLEASVRVSAWLDHLEASGASPATVSIRLSSIRSAVQLGRLMELIEWDLEVPAVRITPLRDTAGPGPDGVRALLRAAMLQADRDKATRDLAILRLLYDLGLRRGEVAGLLLEHLDLRALVLRVREKGRPQLLPLTLPTGTAAALQAWLSRRGEDPGPLFHRLDNGGANLEAFRPLTGRAIWDLVHELGQACGVEARPHGLRHSAITAALDAGYDLRAVQRFSRHRRADHVIRYDDNRKDLGGAIAARLSVEVERVH